MDRKLKLLSSEISKLLINQLGHELENFMLYNMFSNYFALEGLPDLEYYYSLRAEEEKHHHDWLLKYLSNADCEVVYPNLKIERNISNLIDPFILTVNKEIETTQMIYSIANQALLEKDHMTYGWLNSKLIPEQIEEENTSRMARQIMELDSDIMIKSSRVLALIK